MNTFKAKEIYEGQKPKFNFGFFLSVILLNIITLPLRLLTWFSKRYIAINNSEWIQMYEDTNLKIEKQKIAANGFDNSIPYFKLNSNDNKLNNLIRNKVFGTFLLKTEDGLLLRLFKSPNSWPNSKLIYINLHNYKLFIIRSIKSSFPDWIVYKIDDKECIDILVEQKDDFKKIIRLTTNLDKKKTVANTAYKP